MKISEIELGQLTDIGRKRTHNEDCLGFFTFGPGEVLAIIADGMGGHSSGEVASRLAVGIIREVYSKEMKEKGVLEALKSAFREANFTILQRSLEEEELKGMGTTLTALAINKEEAFVGHMGDSRAYLIRNETLTQLTKDHTMVNRMIEQGLLSEEEARRHPQRNVIYKTLGVNMDSDLQLLGPIPIFPNDIFLLCTDGLTNLVTDQEILEMIKKAPPQEACENLVQLANQRGGHDNITVEILKLQKKEKTHFTALRKKKILLFFILILLILLFINSLFLFDPELLKKLTFLSFILE